MVMDISEPSIRTGGLHHHPRATRPPRHRAHDRRQGRIRHHDERRRTRPSTWPGARPGQRRRHAGARWTAARWPAYVTDFPNGNTPAGRRTWWPSLTWGPPRRRARRTAPSWRPRS
ncbi:MAG: hypothetical protein ACLRWQ_14795 [Flavonifractor plautii]